MIEIAGYVTCGLLLGIALSALLLPALQWAARLKNQWQETIWFAYVGAVLFVGILVTRELQQLPIIGGRIARNTSIFVLVWLVPVYLMIGRAWRQRKQREASAERTRSPDDRY